MQENCLCSSGCSGFSPGHTSWTCSSMGNMSCRGLDGLVCDLLSACSCGPKKTKTGASRRPHGQLHGSTQNPNSAISPLFLWFCSADFWCFMDIIGTRSICNTFPVVLPTLPSTFVFLPRHHFPEPLSFLF